MAYLGDRAPGHALLKQLQHVVETAPAAPPLCGTGSWLPLEAHSQHQGILGELAVAQLFDTLPPGGTVLDSVPLGDIGSDIDHVAISPSRQVITINIKYHQGASVWVGERAVMVNGHGQTYIQDVRFESSRAAEKPSAAVGVSISVRPFLSIVGARSLSVRQQPEGATVTTLTDLVRLVRRTTQGGSAPLGQAVSPAASESYT